MLLQIGIAEVDEDAGSALRTEAVRFVLLAEKVVLQSRVGIAEEVHVLALGVDQKVA